jgi:translocation and assembly module TamB
VKSKYIGLDLTANIELNEKETLSIIIDPITGDKLTVKGNSTLTLAIDPTGDMQLSGRYEITEGSYDLSFYKLVKRNFSIRKGSTITWSGDPLLATMDITASYEVETSPLDLVINQMPITDQQQTNMYKQRLPFLVYLNIRGDLLTPDISFELDMPVDSRDAMAGSIYAKIKDINTRESDLNKQVFALLILRRFVSDNPFETEAGSDVASTARRSVSKLLTEQLNRLSENIKGVELSFDVKSYEDYTTGEAQGQTEVQLGVSKSLLDDRLIVKVSGNVDIEGNATNQNSFTDYIGDLALEYKLTEDGRFRITGFRNNNYDIISGELIETGAGLIYIKDYNALRELFKANAKTK